MRGRVSGTRAAPQSAQDATSSHGWNEPERRWQLSGWELDKSEEGRRTATRVTALLKMLVCSTQQLVEWTDVVKIKSCTFQTIDKWMFWRVHDKGFFSQEEIFFYNAQEENRNRTKTCCVNSFLPCASRVDCKSIHPSLGKYFCKAPYFQVILC